MRGHINETSSNKKLEITQNRFPTDVNCIVLLTTPFNKKNPLIKDSLGHHVVGGLQLYFDGRILGNLSTFAYITSAYAIQVASSSHVMHQARTLRKKYE